jgi:Na+/proline symporter/nitrogen-specific signal transduction histidine kinase
MTASASPGAGAVPAWAALPPAVVLGASLAYLLALFAVATWGQRRAAAGRSVIGNAGVYALSMGVYCTAWTYFGSVGRAASGGLWFLPIYLGPTLAMVLAWPVLRKMIRISRRFRITSIADFIASRYGKSRVLAGAVTLIALVGVVPYVALQLKAVASGYALLTGAPTSGAGAGHGTALAVALLLAGFTIVFGTRQLDTTERHEGLVAAIAAESLVKLLAFMAVGMFVTWGLFAGPADLFTRALAVPEIARVLQAGAAVATAETSVPIAGGGPTPITGDAWFALLLLAMLSVIMLPRQWQVMVVENVDERHVRRAAWAFPAYLWLINLFVLPVACGGLLFFGVGRADPESFVLSLPLAAGAPGLALLAFIGGLSAATGMVVVEAIAVSTMVCNDLVLPLLLRQRRFAALAPGRDLTRLVLAVRRAVIVALLLLGWLYFSIAGEAYALVSIGLISFAAVAQFAPALLGGMYWKGGTRNGAFAGLAAGALLWGYTLLLPSIARSGWLDAGFVQHGLFGWAALRPEALFGGLGLDNLSHALFWSLLVNAGLFVAVSLAWPPSAREASQALSFVDVFESASAGRVFWRGRARAEDLQALVGRFLGAERAAALFAGQARERGPAGLAGRAGADGAGALQADAALVHFAETQLAGAIGSASARAMVASVVEEEALGHDDVLRIVEEASELRHLNEQLKSLDRLKDDFMSSVTHELRTPLASIRALAELMRDEPEMAAPQRRQFLAIVVAETERLSRLVNQVLDLAKIESGHADWHNADVDLAALLHQAVQTTAEMFRERGAVVELQAPAAVATLRADPDRLLQVLLNLLSNAAKFVPPGRGRVLLQLREEPGWLSVAVQDNGPGVPLAQQELVFEKFRQGGDASAGSGDSAARPQGTGLGLPISRQIVEHFGGRLWLRSVPGEGACFGFDIPLAAPALAPPGATPAPDRPRDAEETRA